MESGAYIIAAIILISLTGCDCPPGADARGYTCVNLEIDLPADCSIACAESTDILRPDHH